MAFHDDDPADGPLRAGAVVDLQHVLQVDGPGVIVQLQRHLLVAGGKATVHAQAFVVLEISPRHGSVREADADLSDDLVAHCRGWC